MSLTPYEALKLAEDARARARGALRGRAKLESLAPALPTAASNTYAVGMSAYSERVRALVELHVLRPAGDPPSLTLLEHGLFELRGALESLPARFEATGRRAARSVALQQRGEVARMLRLKPIRGHSADEARFLDAFAAHQVGLLERINTAQVAQIRKIMASTPADQLAAEIRRALWVSRNRAQQVAHNEVHALATDVVAYWSQAWGSQEFYWLTCRDELVRPGHAALDGNIYRWDEPPNTGRREGNNLPGHPPHCRCRALPAEAPGI